LEALKKEGLSTSDIDYVFVSHYHPDHCLLMGIFENATVFDSIQFQKGPIGGETKDTLPDTDIQIIKTPGHTSEHSSLLVNTEKGKILVGADIFWWTESEKQEINLEKHDDFASNQEELEKSRQKALEIADYIIPGHGKMFKTK
jgi:glyoxylase-like metal-dependent hydrolase (beta-lactamase superfamily II)